MSFLTERQRKQMLTVLTWVAGAILLPGAIWGAKTYDALKLDTHTFTIYVQQQAAEQGMKDLRDSARYADLLRHVRYGNCLQETRGNVRGCAHLRGP